MKFDRCRLAKPEEFFAVDKKGELTTWEYGDGSISLSEILQRNLEDPEFKRASFDIENNIKSILYSKNKALKNYHLSKLKVLYDIDSLFFYENDGEVDDDVTHVAYVRFINSKYFFCATFFTIYDRDQYKEGSQDTFQCRELERNLQRFARSSSPT